MAFVLIDDEQTRQLRDSGVSLGVLFEKAPDPYFLGNLKGAFIDVNRAAEELTGYAREELIGKSFLKLKLLSPRQIAKATTLIARNALGKDTGPDEFILTRKDGKQVPVEIRTHPVKIQGKQVVLGLVRDITERKRAKEALRERVKELGCLYAISELIEKPGISLEEILQGAVDLIPTAWQYPEIACARIIVDGKQFETENFGETIWKQASNILLHGERIGIIEVCYLEERDERDEGPFLKEERSLLNIVTKRLGHIAERKQAEEKLIESEEDFQQVVSNIGTAVWRADIGEDGTFENQYTSPVYDELLGLPAGGSTNDWDKHLSYVKPEYLEQVNAAFREAIESPGKIIDLDFETLKDNGQTAWFNSKGRCFEKKGKLRVFGSTMDITERKRAEEAPRQTSQRIERLHQIAHDLETCEDEDQVYRLTVEAAERTLSFSVCTLEIVEEDRLVVKAASSAVPSGASQGRELKEGGLAAKTYRTKETTVFGRIEDVPEATPVREDIRSGISAPVGDIGVFQVASTKANAFTDEDARLLELLLSYTAEAVKRIHTQKELEQQAIHDPLTGAYSRRYFDQTIEKELQRSKRYDRPIAFLMIDIDHFKEINDTFGHQRGDKVLQTVASVLHEQVRENDLVIRYSDDEFLVVLPETDGKLEVIRERIQQAVAKTNKENSSFDFPITLSIGAAHWQPDDDLPIEQVLASADERMYEEKREKSTN